MKFRLRWFNYTAQHISVTFFSGPDKDHMANTGSLTFTHEEAKAFRNTIRSGVHEGGYTGCFESFWPFGEAFGE